MEWSEGVFFQLFVVLAVLLFVRVPFEEMGRFIELLDVDFEEKRPDFLSEKEILEALGST